MPGAFNPYGPGEQNAGGGAGKPFKANPYLARFIGDEDTGDFMYKTGVDANGKDVYKAVPNYLRTAPGSRLSETKLKEARELARKRRLEPQLEAGARAQGERAAETHRLGIDTGRTNIEVARGTLANNTATTESGIRVAEGTLANNTATTQSGIRVAEGTLELNRDATASNIANQRAGEATAQYIASSNRDYQTGMINVSDKNADTGRLQAESTDAYQKGLLAHSQAELMERGRQFDMDHSLARDVNDLNEVNGSRAWVMGNISNFVKAAAGLGA